MLMVTVIIMGHQQAFIYAIKEIWYPAFSASPTVTTLALAPIMVPFPPRQAPSDSDHQSTPDSAPGMVWFRKAMMGSMVAVKGMLSMKAEAMWPGLKFFAHWWVG